MSPIDRSLCSATRHGTYVEYQNDRCRCPDACESHRLYSKRLREGRLELSTIDATGTRRRLQALVAIGHDQIDLDKRLGWTDPRRSVYRIISEVARVKRYTADQVDELYRELRLKPGPSKRARNQAIQLGWVSALASDDIDNDPKPQSGPRRKQVA